MTKEDYEAFDNDSERKALKAYRAKAAIEYFQGKLAYKPDKGHPDYMALVSEPHDLSKRKHKNASQSP